MIARGEAPDILVRPVIVKATDPGPASSRPRFFEAFRDFFAAANSEPTGTGGYVPPNEMLLTPTVLITFEGTPQEIPTGPFTYRVGEPSNNGEEH